MMFRTFLAFVLLVFLAISGARADLAFDGIVPPRLALLTGTASFWRGGSADWAPAEVNLPLQAGDALNAAPETSMEIQVGAQAWLRAAGGSYFQFGRIAPGFVQLRLLGGDLALDVRKLSSGESLQVDLPDGVVTVSRRGYYRFRVNPDSASVITRQGGQARLAPTGEASRVVKANEEAVLPAGRQPVQVYLAPGPDAWDQWNFNRSAYLVDAASARYVPAGVYGLADLGRHGIWREDPSYGPVWIPSQVPMGWAPYSQGHWVADPVFGWTWVDEAPWGYAPFHYGRWVFLGKGWAWAPGPKPARLSYSPALVAWFDTAAGGLAWVALGWGEPVLPWWGGAGMAGRPHWGGWGGPRFVNRQAIGPSAAALSRIDVRSIVYENASRRGGVSAMEGERLGSGRAFSYERPQPDALRHAWRPAEHGPASRPGERSARTPAAHASPASASVLPSSAPPPSSSRPFSAPGSQTRPESWGPAPQAVAPQPVTAPRPQAHPMQRQQTEPHQFQPHQTPPQPQAQPQQVWGQQPRPHQTQQAQPLQQPQPQTVRQPGSYHAPAVAGTAQQPSPPRAGEAAVPASGEGSAAGVVRRQETPASASGVQGSAREVPRRRASAFETSAPAVGGSAPPAAPVSTPSREAHERGDTAAARQRWAGGERSPGTSASQRVVPAPVVSPAASASTGRVQAEAPVAGRQASASPVQPGGDAANGPKARAGEPAKGQAVPGQEGKSESPSGEDGVKTRSGHSRGRDKGEDSGPH